MKFQLLILVFIFSLFTDAKAKPKGAGPTKLAKKDCSFSDFDPKLIRVTETSEESTKGTLFYDPKSCQFKMFRECVLISEINKNFKIEFSDGRSITGAINGTNQDRPPCFHTLTKYLRPGLMVFTNGLDGGLKSCYDREMNPNSFESKSPSAALANSVSYLTTQEYNESCGTGDNNCRRLDRVIELKRGAGLVFYKKAFGPQTGSNLKTKDLIDLGSTYSDAYSSKCEKKPEIKNKDQPKAEPKRST